jgi:hypothetical protein
VDSGSGRHEFGGRRTAILGKALRNPASKVASGSGEFDEQRVVSRDT